MSVISSNDSRQKPEAEKKKAHPLPTKVVPLYDSGTSKETTVVGESVLGLPPTKETFTIVSCAAKLYLWDEDDSHFLKQADIISSIKANSSYHVCYIIATTNKGQQLLSHKIRAELNARWSTKLYSITWNYTSRTGHLSSWCIKFEDAAGFEEFRVAYSTCLCQSINAESHAKMKVRQNVCDI